MKFKSFPLDIFLFSLLLSHLSLVSFSFFSPFPASCLSNSLDFQMRAVELDGQRPER
jgi:hypothetical protein